MKQNPPVRTERRASHARINIKISRKAYKVLSKRAKSEGRTMLAALDNLLSV